MPPEWQARPVSLALGEDELHVWRFAVALDAAAVAELAALLTPDEQNRAARFVFPADRRRFVVARGRLRMLLGAYLGEGPAELRFAYSPHGRPSLAGPAPRGRLGFNLAHSGELALIAVAWGRRVGVDVERLREDLDYAALLPGVFSARERRDLAALPDPLRRRAFYDGWTRKEAYLKARGDGLSYPPDRVEVSLAPGRPAALQPRPEEAAGGPWSLIAIDPGEGYAAAVAVEGGALRLSLFAHQ